MPVKKIVSRQFKEGRRITKSDDNCDVLEILDFETEHVAHTTVKLGLTVCPRQFESVRLDISVSVPHYLEESDNAFLFALDKCEQYVYSALGDDRKETARILGEKAKRILNDEEK